MPPNFADLYKPVKDLLTKKYNGDSHKVDVKVKDVVTFNPVFTRNAAGAVSGTVAVDGSYQPCDWCLLKLKYTISTAGNLKTNIKAEKLAPGLLLEGNWDAALGDSVAKDTYDLTAKYSTKAANAEAKVAKGKSTIAELSFVYAALADLNVGGLLNMNLLSRSYESFAFGAAYAASDKSTVLATFQRDVAADGFKETVKAGFVTKSHRYTFAGEYATTLADPKKGIITVGLETALEGGQTVKAKADTKGTLGLSLQHALDKQTKLCSSVELTTTKDAVWGSKFGSEIIFES
jgi:hypothetical protein